ncbi:hypothetical protein RA210_U220004 [Rubrivivax sp. A210]|nr:hypothetical protein RA210_U220004 [Rubrivivax sp. A210]
MGEGRLHQARVQRHQLALSGRCARIEGITSHGCKVCSQRWRGHRHHRLRCRRRNARQ